MDNGNYDTSFNAPEKREECGIVAIYSKKGKNIAPYLYRALTALQHRGQDACGITVFDGKKLITKKGLGLVGEFFKEGDLEMNGSSGVGHVRYPTSGYVSEIDVQPFVHKNIAVAHNGHIANDQEIKEGLSNKGYRFKTSVDSEVFAFMIDQNLNTGLETSIRTIMKKVDGAYSNVAIIDGKIIAFRDPHGIRPLVYAENEEFVCIASESCALDINNMEYLGDIEGGELAQIKDGKLTKAVIDRKTPYHCMFEYVYFSRPDSILNSKSVFEAREKLGEILAKEYPVNADIVVPIPDTARTAAEAYSRISKIPVQEGLIKNRYIGRTFIMPSQNKREDAVRMKLNPIKEVVYGKKIVLVDDSIVRGTTLKEIVALVRSAGAREIHLRITCPPIRAPCFYGVNMKTYKELIANNKTVEEIRRFIGADSLGYISIEGLKRAIGLSICTGCLNEDYKTPFAKKMAEEKKDEDAKCG